MLICHLYGSGEMSCLRSLEYFPTGFFLRVLCIFWIIVLYQMCLLAYISPPVCGLSSHSLDVVLLLSRSFLLLMKSSLSISSLMDGAMGVACKKSSSNRQSSRFSLTFYSKMFIVLCFTFRSVIHFEFIFANSVKYMFRLLLFLACGCPVVPLLFVEETVFHCTAFALLVNVN